MAPFNNTGGIAPSFLLGILLVKYADISVTKLPPTMSISPNLPSMLDNKQPMKRPGIAADSTNGKSAKPSEILNCIGPNAKSPKGNCINTNNIYIYISIINI